MGEGYLGLKPLQGEASWGFETIAGPGYRTEPGKENIINTCVNYSEPMLAPHGSFTSNNDNIFFC